MLIATLISIILFLSYAALILFYYNAWKSIPDFTSLKTNLSTKISIIIPARNEEQNVLDCLASLKNQTYSKNLYEVIVVDDHSTDNTWSVLQNFPHEEMNFKKLKLSDHITDSNKNKAYKKLAIETAINNAEGNLIVTSDADCTFNNTWLQTIVRFYETTNAKFIAAPVRIKCSTNLLDIFQTLDFITLQGITAASVSKKFHSMCNGANLAYEKNVFFEVDGFKNIDNIPSGDDMLLMHKIYKKYSDNIFYLKNRNAIVTTQSQSSWKNFFNQRIRWASKADVYDDKRIFWVLLLVYCFNLLFLVLAIVAFWNIQFLLIAAALLILKIFVEFLFVNSVAKFFDQRSLIIYFPFLQPLHILYIIISGFFGKFGSYQWKGRKVVNREK
ncbi:MAG TPA: glycosyltransferase [Puia sp.]|jgi:glycosyltransferase involved in cell wall biosynthesis|nr:glycosyltransferase [Puia sp.]